MNFNILQLLATLSFLQNKEKWIMPGKLYHSSLTILNEIIFSKQNILWILHEMVMEV